MLIDALDEQVQVSKPCITLIPISLLVILAMAGLHACELTEKNVSYDACLAGKAPCPEICNGEDDDDDGLIDEALSEACIVLSSVKLDVFKSLVLEDNRSG